MADIFDSYQLAGAWDEMFEAPGLPRGPYQPLVAALQPLEPSELRYRADQLARIFTDRGVTFDYAGEERPFPLDLIPRVIDAVEWDLIARGVRLVAAAEISAWVHQHVEYVPGSTGVQTGAQEAWDKGQGVCQDVAHLTVALLREVASRPGMYRDTCSLSRRRSRARNSPASPTPGSSTGRASGRPAIRRTTPASGSGMSSWRQAGTTATSRRSRASITAHRAAPWRSLSR